ncbi:hypothetical protein [Streptomyces sp. NBRC 110028]|uniref:hypothetical protein n=1 Tax=Streptomyces sp. NBRC 110028 TaxID=1621260 RepID=UPI00131A8F45|nr:hypothetical protein [Streptomyces sp. NBRC 110028]
MPAVVVAPLLAGGRADVDVDVLVVGGDLLDGLGQLGADVVAHGLERLLQDVHGLVRDRVDGLRDAVTPTRATVMRFRLAQLSGGLGVEVDAQAT